MGRRIRTQKGGVMQGDGMAVIRRMAVCQNPEGEGQYVPLDPGESLVACFMPGCNCVPVEYVPADDLRGAVEALQRIRDHGQTHDEPCWAITNGDCADVMQEIARATLDTLGGQ